MRMHLSVRYADCMLAEIHLHPLHVCLAAKDYPKDIYTLQIKEDEPKLGKIVRVLKVPINEVYNFAAHPEAATGSADLIFRFMPDAAEIVSALEVRHNSTIHGFPSSCNIHSSAILLDLHLWHVLQPPGRQWRSVLLHACRFWIFCFFCTCRMSACIGHCGSHASSGPAMAMRLACACS